ncbi:DMT family transporter [Roseibium sp. RKSG952]|uniref:DMT family transporter n=1 Tax=Roseibium sp. RKSG952 TaxID=2529384 RepID=UPI0012BB7942|nr:DMT family transporter [Roseibium sp. RKSG952]MTH96860.1 DMT family transporter [Roseibium sp. RKSG952]
MTGQAPISNRAFAIAIGLMVASAVCVAAVGLFGKEMTQSLDLTAAVFLRFFAPFLVLAGLMIVYRQPLKWASWRHHAFRAGFAFGAQLCFFYTLGKGSLLIATLLFTTSGLFLPFVTRLAFGTEIKPRTLLAVIISFAGVAVILDPTSQLQPFVLVGLLAGLFNAGSQAVQHRQSKMDAALPVTFAMFGIGSVLSALLVSVAGDWAVFGSVMGTGGHAIVILVLTAAAFAVFTIGNQWLRSIAFSYVNKPASLTPFYYSSIVFAAALDWIVYGQAPALHAYIGLVFVIAGTVIMSRRSQPAPGA